METQLRPAATGKRVMVTYRLPRQLVDQIRKVAKKRKVTVTSVVEVSLGKGLKELE